MIFLSIAIMIGALAGCAAKSQDPVQIVRAYLQAVQKGDAEAAWNLIHPDRQTAANRGAFDEMIKTDNHPRVAKELSLQAEESPWSDKLTEKNLPGGHIYQRVAVVKATWTNGDIQLIHLIQDQTGNWRLVWSPTFALE